MVWKFFWTTFFDYIYYIKITTTKIEIMNLSSNLISLIGEIVMHFGEAEINVWHVTTYLDYLTFNKTSNEIECPINDAKIENVRALKLFMQKEELQS